MLRNRSASIAAMAPLPALVTGWVSHWIVTWVSILAWKCCRLWRARIKDVFAAATKSNLVSLPERF
jgi:hypothetical protein